MSIQEVLLELPLFTVGERHLLIRRSLDLDEPSLTSEEEELILSRLFQHHQNPISALTLEQLTSKLNARLNP